MSERKTEAARDLALRAAAFDALPSQVAVLDRDGVIRATNSAWTDFAVENDVTIAPEMVGRDYLAACADGDDEDAAAHGWEGSVAESDAGGARFEFSGVTSAA